MRKKRRSGSKSCKKLTSLTTREEGAAVPSVPATLEELDPRLFAPTGDIYRWLN